MLEFTGGCLGIMILVNNGSCHAFFFFFLFFSRSAGIDFEMPWNIYHHYFKIFILIEQDMNM